MRWLEQRGYPSDLARRLLVEMAKIVVTLRCQKAWLDAHLDETRHLDLQAQPLVSETVLPTLAARVRSEFARADASTAHGVANAWMNAAVERVLARTGG